MDGDGCGFRWVGGCRHMYVSGVGMGRGLCGVGILVCGW